MPIRKIIICNYCHDHTNGTSHQTCYANFQIIFFTDRLVVWFLHGLHGVIERVDLSVVMANVESQPTTELFLCIHFFFCLDYHSEIFF